MENYESLLKNFKKLIPLETIKTASDDRPELSGKIFFDSESLETFLSIIHAVNVITSEQNKIHINQFKKKIEQFIKDGTPVTDEDYIRFISDMQMYAYCCGQYNGAVNTLNTLHKALSETSEEIE